jgi:hypothetical protein
MTKSEKEHYAKLARLGCILCKQLGVREIEDSPTEMHHVRKFGMPRNLSPVIPLCAFHHRLGDTSIHLAGSRKFAIYWGYSQEDLIDKVRELLDE